jgi:acyl-CoA synthetase (AMP-forming)/AMP-acid ligase II/acyl carrier protein
MATFSILSDVLLERRSTDRAVTFIEANDDHRRLSYEQLYLNSLRVLHDLQASDLSAGDQLIILLKDNRTFVEAFWACVLGGIVPVPVAVGISDEHRAKLLRIFNRLERPYLFTTQADLERLLAYGKRNDMLESVNVVVKKTILAEQLQQHDSAGTLHSPRPDDIAFIQFSSGSTSEPKGVVLTHGNVVTNIKAITEAGAHTHNDVSLSWMPLTHDMGLVGFHLNMLSFGADQHLMPTDLFSRRPLLWLQKASEIKASLLCSPNFGYKHFLKALGDKELENVDLSHVRLIYNGAEPISIELCKQFLDRMAVYGLRREAMFTVYGLAEATLAVSFPNLNQGMRAVYLDRHGMRVGEPVRFLDKNHVDAVGFAVEGRPVPEMQVKITDTANTELDRLHIGLIQIRGGSVTRGYYLDEETNKTALTGDGWLDTGDIGFLTGQGELVVTGREKDILFAHGQNYYPHDIESVALQLPELELGKIVATGVRRPGSDSDELVVFILFRADYADFVGIARDVSRHITEHMGLEVSHVIPVKRIPKTTSGKLQRRALGNAFLQGEFDDVLGELNRHIEHAGSVPDSGLSSMENRLKQLCEEVIKDRSIGIDDNFFELGISSLTLTEIHQNVDQEFPGVVDITDLFEHQTLRELAKHIESKG